LAALVLVTGCGGGSTNADKEQSAEPYYVGVTGPFTGDNAEYGTMWKKGFEIALEEINADGGINGRPIELLYEDSQSDPKQAASIAQKFVADERVVAQLGDFSTTATWAASPIYQSAGLVQLAFTPSHPQLTKPGDVVFQLSPTQADEGKALANVALNVLKAKKVAIIHLNSDFGKAVKDMAAEQITAAGGEVLTTQSYLPTDKDFKSQLTEIKKLNPELIILGSYYTDAALIVKQAKDLEINATYLATAAVHSPALLTLGGKDVEGLITLSVFDMDNPSPTLKSFTEKYQAKFGAGEPDTFAVQAYDAIRLIANAIEKGDGSRQSIRDELAKTTDFPGASQTKITYSPTRQLTNPEIFPIQVKDGKYVTFTP
jgi:branched-chain amino acid transport system substrate-binding protein